MHAEDIMKLTNYTDFSLRTLIFLALQDENVLVTTDDVANHFKILKNHLTKVIHKLSKHGFIKTVRGKNGGICLALPPEKINLAEVVQAMESNVEIVNCAQPICPLNNNCELKGILDEAQSAFFSTLGKYSLADITHQPNKILSFLNIN